MQYIRITSVSVCLAAHSAVGRLPRQVSVKRAPSTTSNVARSPSVARHASTVRRAPSFRPEDISTPTFQSSTNSLLAAAPTASEMAEERSTPRPVRSPRLPDDDRIQPTRVAPPPPAAQSSISSLFRSSFEGLHSSRDKPYISSPNVTVDGPPRSTDQLGASSSSPSFCSAVEDPRHQDHSDSGGAGASEQRAVRAPPRPRHTLNKVARAESLRQDHPSSTPAAVNHGHVDHSAAASVVASLRDRFEARRRAAADLPDTSETVSPDAPETIPAATKPNIPPKPGGKDDGQVGRVKRLQRQPAFREFDVVNTSKLSTTELTHLT